MAHYHFRLLTFIFTALCLFSSHGCRKQEKLNLVEKILTTKGHVTAIKYSPDSRYLVASIQGFVDGENHWKGHLLVWDVNKKKKILEKELSLKANSISFSLDGKLLAVGCGIYDEFPQKDKFEDKYHFSPGFVVLFDATNFREVQRIPMKKWVSYVSFSPKGSYLAVAESDDPKSEVDIHMLETKTWTKKWTFKGQKEAVITLSISPDEKFMATGDQLIRNPNNFKKLINFGGKVIQGEIKIWSMEQREHIFTIAGTRGRIGSLSYSKDGKNLLMGSWEDVGIADVSTGAITTFGKQSWPKATFRVAEYLPGGDRLVAVMNQTGGDVSKLVIYDIVTKIVFAETISNYRLLAVSKDGCHVAAAIGAYIYIFKISK